MHVFEVPGSCDSITWLNDDVEALQHEVGRVVVGSLHPIVQPPAVLGQSLVQAARRATPLPGRAPSGVCLRGRVYWPLQVAGAAATGVRARPARTGTETAPIRLLAGGISSVRSSSSSASGVDSTSEPTVRWFWKKNCKLPRTARAAVGERCYKMAQLKDCKNDIVSDLVDAAQNRKGEGSRWVRFNL